MTDIHAILGGIGLSVPEDKKADFDKAVRENYKTVAEVEKIEKARDNFKAQYDDVSGKLKDFEGVDVAELKGKIETLNTTIATNNAKHAEELDNLEFNSVLEAAVTAAKGKNVKAISALLDIPTLKKSKNRAEDVKAAVEAAKGADGYLFDSDKPQPQITVPGRTKPPITNEKAYLDSFYKGNPFYKE